jgi:hypothetical protein
LDLAELGALSGVEAVEEGGGGRYEVSVSSPRDVLANLLRWSENDGRDLRELEVEPASLEDVFLAVTGRTIRD